MYLMNSIKHFTAPEFNQFREQELASHFSQKIKYTKPEASRSSSSEAYFVCQGFKG
jgi:23S rRNA (uridine2552-2'-O)-methyltransferase